MKPPNEAISQRVLALTLIYAIRNALAFPYVQEQTVAHIRDLAVRCPVGIRSVHVRRRLGTRRLAWLAENVDSTLGGSHGTKP